MFEWVRRLAGAAAPPRVDEDQWRRVESELPFLDFLPEAAVLGARRLALSFLERKEFFGANQLALNDHIMLSIAYQASLPILRLGIDAYRGWVGIVVYPGDFVVRRRQFDQAGVMHEFDDTLLGEAWPGGPVLLSWFEGPARPSGVNVVIHEFAHKLDMVNGEVDGLPALAPGMSAEAWAEAFAPAYEDFCRRVDSGEQTAIDPYASESPAEFFAVTSEAFFISPLHLRADYPKVYEQLSALYGLDPAEGEARVMAEQWRAKHEPGAGPPVEPGSQ